MTTVSNKLFDTLPDGREVYAYTIDGGCGVVATILNYGGILNSLFVTDKNGISKNVVLGYEKIEYHAKRGAYYGALVGRCANRIGKSRFILDGKEYILPNNDKANQLHGGPEGFSYKIWDVTVNSDNSLTLTLDSPDGDMGYPGNLTARVTYSVDGRALEIRYEATTDAPTIVNLTNHAYFDITGAGSGRTLEQILWLDCDRMSDTDRELIPNGEIIPVAGTPYDFTTLKAVGRDIECDYKLLRYFNGYDTNYFKKDYQKKISPIATLTDPQTDLSMTVMTDLPCVQLYTTNSVDEGAPDFASGAVHTLHCGVCLETQAAPDAINTGDCDSVILRPDGKYESYTAFVFGGTDEQADT